MMKIQVYKLNPEQVCRTCFSMDSPLADVSSVSFNGESLVQLLKYHLSINLVSDDELPKNICGNCICELHRMHAFITKSKDTQSKLEAIFQKGTEVEKKTEEIEEQEVMEQIKEEIDCTDNNILNVSTGNVQTGNSKGSESIDTILKVKSLYEQLIDEIKSQNVENDAKENIVIEENDDDLIELNLSTENDEIQKNKTCLPQLVPEQGPPYICDCKMSFDNLNELNEHRSKFNHEKVPLYICEICKDRKMYLYEECKNHIVGHFRNKSYRCDRCEKSFSRITALTMHWKKHLDYKCNVCAREFETPVKLKTHRRSNCSGNICRFCSQIYHEGRFHTHLKRSCKSLSTYVCNICNLKLTSENHLLVHKRRCIAKNELDIKVGVEEGGFK